MIRFAINIDEFNAAAEAAEAELDAMEPDFSTASRIEMEAYMRQAETMHERMVRYLRALRDAEAANLISSH